MNGHKVDFRGDSDDVDALVIVENLDPMALLVFEEGSLASVCARLGRGYGNQYTTLQVDRANYRAIAAALREFARMGVRLSDLSDQAAGAR